MQCCPSTIGPTDRKLQQQARLADARVADEHQLKQMVAARRDQHKVRTQQPRSRLVPRTTASPRANVLVFLNLCHPTRVCRDPLRPATCLGVWGYLRSMFVKSSQRIMRRGRCVSVCGADDDEPKWEGGEGEKGRERAPRAHDRLPLPADLAGPVPECRPCLSFLSVTLRACILELHEFFRRLTHRVPVPEEPWRLCVHPFACLRYQPSRDSASSFFLHHHASKEIQFCLLRLQRFWDWTTGQPISPPYARTSSIKRCVASWAVLCARMLFLSSGVVVSRNND